MIDAWAGHPAKEGTVPAKDADEQEPMTAFKYAPLQLDEGRPKKLRFLHKGSLLQVEMQLVGPGGETNLHAHTGQEETWIVLKGAARFHGQEPGETWQLGLFDGIFIPQGTPYWFESVGDEPLEILRVSARDPNARDERVNYEALKGWQGHLGGRAATDAESVR